MPNVRVTWTLPTTRESGKPLNPADIRGVSLELSADGEAFSEFGEFPPTELSTIVQDLEPGLWVFRGKVIDTKGRPSTPVSRTIDIPVPEDTTPPSPLLTLDLSLV